MAKRSLGGPETIIDSVGTGPLLKAIDVAEIEEHLEARAPHSGERTR